MLVFPVCPVKVPAMVFALALTALGLATALLGLAIGIPVLGYATWHAYRETIDAGAWPPHVAG